MIPIIPIAVSVHTVVSWIFAMTLREPWNSTIFGAFFVAGAIFSGIAMLIILMAVLRKVRIPNMLPFLFTALKVGATLAFIGALVGEYFGGTSEVLGQFVLTSMSSGRFDLAWAGILIGAVAAIVAYLSVSIIERIAIPWHASVRAE